MSETSSSRLRLFRATPDDQERLLKLYSEKSRDGHVRINLDMSPDVFAALSVEGFKNEVFAVEDVSTGELAGAGVRNLRHCYVNGTMETVGYLSGLRVAAKYRKSRAMFLIFKQLRDLYLQGECFGYLTSVFNSNTVAKNVLTSGKAGMPRFREVGQLTTFVFKPQYLSGPRSKDCETRTATEADIPELVKFLQTEGARYQFFPYLDEEDFRQQRGFLKELDINQVWIARKQGSIAGCMAFIDQSAFRRWKVDGYSPVFKKMRGALNLGNALLGLPSFPKEQQNFNYHLLSLVCIRDFDAEIFKTLFNKAVNPLMQKEKPLVLLSLFNGSPFTAELPLLKFSFKSTIFIGYWGETLTQIESLDNRFPHLEAASL